MRREKAALEAANQGNPPKKAKTLDDGVNYNCRTCQKPTKSPGHSQLKGRRYCPLNPIPYPEWKAIQQAEIAAIALAKQQGGAE